MDTISTSTRPFQPKFRVSALCVCQEDEAKVDAVNALGASQVNLPASGVGSSQYAREVILTAPGGGFTLKHLEDVAPGTEASEGAWTHCLPFTGR